MSTGVNGHESVPEAPYALGLSAAESFSDSSDVSALTMECGARTRTHQATRQHLHLVDFCLTGDLPDHTGIVMVLEVYTGIRYVSMPSFIRH
jgi:hypothetical protein